MDIKNYLLNQSLNTAKFSLIVPNTNQICWPSPKLRDRHYWSYIINGLPDRVIRADP